MASRIVSFWLSSAFVRRALWTVPGARRVGNVLLGKFRAFFIRQHLLQQIAQLGNVPLAVACRKLFLSVSSRVT
jgi:hypothetical protein